MRALSERTVTLVASLWRNSMTEQEQCEQDLKKRTGEDCRGLGFSTFFDE